MTGTGFGLVVEPFVAHELGERELAEVCELRNAADPEVEAGDPPRSVDFYRGMFAGRAAGSKDYHGHYWWARQAGALVGYAEGVIRTTGDNAHLIMATVEVAPRSRRRGVACALLGAVVEAARGHQRRVLMGAVGGPEPLESCPGSAFARALGGAPGREQHANRLRLDTLDRALVQRWVNEGARRSPDVELVWRRGAFAEEELEPLARLFQVTKAGQPTDTLEVEPFRFTAESVRASERFMEKLGAVPITLLARRRADRTLLGYTMLAADPGRPRALRQFGTGVDPAERGRGLGKWLKATMLQHVLESFPEREEIRTRNADSNAAMLAINDRLGFRPWIAECTWQAPLDGVEAYLRSRA